MDFEDLETVSFDDFIDEEMPQDEDLVTEDYVKFYRLGFQKPAVVRVPEGADWADCVRAYQDREKYWPNVWFLGERGDFNLIDMATGEFA